MSTEDGIRDFWLWWDTARERLLRAIEIEQAFTDELVQDISAHVDAIGDFDWELAPGTTSRHAFCLSPKGDPEARLVTELWRHRGPEPDEIWEYYAARQPGQGSRIELEGVALDREDLVAELEIDRARERIDATYYHPAFPRLPEELRAVALYLLLDGGFGEDGVERWLGAIEVADAPPPGAVPFDELAAAVADLAVSATGEQYAVLRGETETGEPRFVTVNRALKRIDHLLYTMHVAIDLAILDPSPHGLTTPADAEALNRLEDELADALGPAAVRLGRETRPGHRVLHWYAPEDGPAQGIIARWAAAHPERAPAVQWTRDPAWELAQRYA